MHFFPPNRMSKWRNVCLGWSESVQLHYNALCSENCISERAFMYWAHILSSDYNNKTFKVPMFQQTHSSSKLIMNIKCCTVLNINLVKNSLFLALIYIWKILVLQNRFSYTKMLNFLFHSVRCARRLYQIKLYVLCHIAFRNA